MDANKDAFFFSFSFCVLRPNTNSTVTVFLDLIFLQEVCYMHTLLSLRVSAGSLMRLSFCINGGYHMLLCSSFFTGHGPGAETLAGDSFHHPPKCLCYRIGFWRSLGLLSYFLLAL